MSALLPKSPRAVSRWLAPSIVAALTLLWLAAIWLVAVPTGPDSCASTPPGPTNCSTSQRVQAAVLPTVTLVVAAVVTVLAVARARSRRAVSIVGALVVLCIGAGGYLAVAWAPVWAVPA
jgi:hypothetical protein